MQRKSVHEPQAEVMDAADVWEDAQQIADLIESNESQPESVVRLKIPLSIFVSALEQFSRDELAIVQQHIEEKLAA